MNSVIDLACDSEDDHSETVILAPTLTPENANGGHGASGSAESSRLSASSKVETGGLASKAGPAPTPKRQGDASNAVRGQGKRRAKRSRSEGVSSLDKPPLFRLLSSPTDKASLGSVQFRDLLSGSFHEALLTNFMVDPQLLLEAQPRLCHVPWVLVCGDREDTSDLRRSLSQINPGIKVHKPEVPQYGVHHTKMMVLKFAQGVRVVILTANFVDLDIGEKSQGVWYQEFPLRSSSPACDFEDTLVDYLERVGGPAGVFGRSLRGYDFRAARVVLIPSVPGTGRTQHEGENLHKYGHMRLRATLGKEIPRLREGGHKLVMQISSLSSLTATPNQWLMELLDSFMPRHQRLGVGKGSSGEGTPDELVLRDTMRVVWPSVEAVRCSTKGWMSGGSICGDCVNIYGGMYNRPDKTRFKNNDPRPELKPLLRKWAGNAAVNRATDSPHIKTYMLYRELQSDDGSTGIVDGEEAAWFLLTSSNLSRSAWGFLDKKTSQKLTVRSFELGVLFTPSLFEEKAKLDGDDDLTFTCTPGEAGLIQRFPLTLSHACAPRKCLPLRLLPIPYRLPAPRYDFGRQDEGNRPWVRDGQYPSVDHKGTTWPPRD